MKKVLLTLAVLFGVTSANAQKVEEFGIFDHLGVGVSVGTTGIGFDVAAPVTDYLQLRAGYSFFPKISYKTDVDIDSDDPSFSTDEVEVEGKLNMSNFEFLADFYPFKASKSGFHITAGFFAGPSKFISVYNTEPFLNPKDWGKAGIKLGDYRVTSDEQGNVQADLKVNGFKPYLGIGFGRAVPKGRIGVQFDMGVQFWGTPGVYTRTVDNFGDVSYDKLKKSDIDNDDADKAFEIMEKITVYPVLKLRICGRIF